MIARWPGATLPSGSWSTWSNRSTGRKRAEPFLHLQLADIFPPDVYERIVQAMPRAQMYNPISVRAREARRPDGVLTRTKIHLLPEFVRHLPPGQREVWSAVGSALCSAPVRDAFRSRLAPGLEKRFGKAGGVDVYPIPMLTRDVTDYRIGIHPDTRYKAITVQLFLPRDDSIRHVGTVFHRRNPEGTYEKALQMPFLPNSGYAFAVGADTYHSLDPLRPEVRTRDSILLTYFVDRTLAQKLQNRVKRGANLLLNEVRSLAR